MYEKLKSEIIDTYIQENNINMKKGKYNVSELTHDVNAIFFKCLESYYFENHTKNEFVKSIDDNENDYYYVVTLPNAKNRKNKIKHKIQDNELAFFEQYLMGGSKSGFEKLSNQRTMETRIVTMDIANALKVLETIPLSEYPVVSDIFSNEYSSYTEEHLKHFPIESPYSGKREIVEIENTQKMSKTIDALKKDPVFNMLLTDDPVQQMLNLKNKNNIEFKKVEATRSNHKDITSLLQFEWGYHVMSTLMNHYSLNYFSQNNDENYTAIVAHNDFEIAGITSIIDSSTYHKFPKNLAAYVSYIEVAEQYYGRKLGIQLMMEAIKHAQENDLILFRTPSSPNGETYIKEKINQIAKTSNVILISEYERDIAFKIIEKNIDQPKEILKKELSDVLNFVRNNYEETKLHDYKIRTEITNYMNKDNSDNKATKKLKI